QTCPLPIFEAKLAQPADDLILHRIVPDGIDQDDARRCGHRPGGILFLTNEIEVVEDLDGFGVIGRQLRWRRWGRARDRAPRRRNAKALKDEGGATAG